MGAQIGAALSCLIVGGGEILDIERAKRLAETYPFVICADSGLDYCGRLGLCPGLIVGDFDSARAEPPPGAEVLCLPTAKDFTDATVALQEAYARGFRRMLLLGVLGGRLDHTLGNLQNLTWCAENGVEAMLSDGRCDVFCQKDGEITLEPREGCYFSVFALSPVCEGVTITNGKYPLDNYNLEYNVPRAVSNEFADGPVTITARRGTFLAVVTPRD